MDQTRSRPERSALTCIFSVELPGIELGTEKALSCGDAELVYVKRRETT
jgi:hypothetical protein